MKPREWWRKCQLLLIIAFGTYPLVMLILDRFASGLLKVGWVFSMVYVILALAGIHVKGKWRLTAGIVLAAGFGAVSAVLAPSEDRIGAIAAAALCGGLLIWSMKMGGWSSKEEIAVLWIACGVLSHLLGQLALHIDRVSNAPELSAYSGSFLAALFGFVLLTMLSMNRNGLNVASGKRQNVPGIMRQKNTLLTMALFALAVLAALLPSALIGIAGVLRQVISWIIRVIAMLIPDTETQKVENIPMPADPGMVAQPGDERVLTLNPVIEKVILLIGAVLSLMMLVFLLYQIYKFMRDIFRRMIMALGRFASNVSEDYIDEVTDTREDLSPEKIDKGRSGSRLPFLEPRNLAPGERIRFRYQRLLRRHPEWDAGTTARETLPGNLAALYERARYSSHPVSEEEATAFSDGSKGI